jgi:hypothetical protein
VADPARLVQVEPELQVGPTCGLVALRMAASTLLERTGRAAAARVCSVHELLAQAIARGFSVQGIRSENCLDVNAYKNSKAREAASQTYAHRLMRTAHQQHMSNTLATL